MLMSFVAGLGNSLMLKSVSKSSIFNVLLIVKQSEISEQLFKLISTA